MVYCAYYTKGIQEKQEKKGGFWVQLLTYSIETCEDGATIKTVLQNRHISTATIRKLKQSNGIFLNEQSVTVRQRVQPGQVLTLRLPETPSEYVKPIPMELQVIYEDDFVLVVNKPAGIPIHPSAGHHNDSLAGGVAYYIQKEDFTFRPITRLDRYTTGLVLIAKDSVSAANLCQQIEKGDIQKTYYAVTQGIPAPLKGTVTAPIARDETSVLKRKVSSDGKFAQTHYQVEDVNSRLALVKVLPITGRRHQIRVHMAHLGCPLLYDFLYGEEEKEKMFLLQCTQLVFTHPYTQERVCVEIPCTIW